MRVCNLFLLGALVIPSTATNTVPDSVSETPQHDEHSSMTMDMEPSPMSMEHHHGRPVLEDPHLEPQQRKYWEQYNTTTFFNSPDGNKFSLWMHAILLFTAVGFLGPLCLLCSTDTRAQWFFIPLQTVQSSITITSIVFLALYSSTAPKLYPGNAYSKLSIAIVFLVALHWFTMIIKAITTFLDLGEYASTEEAIFRSQHEGPRFDDNEDPDAYLLDEINEDRERSSSSNFTEVDSETELSSFDCERDSVPKHILNKGHGHSERRTAPRVPSMVQKLAANRLFAKANSVLGRFSGVLFNLLNYPLFFAECGFLLVGLATAFVMGQRKNVFGLLAHFIKGFVFFLLGYVELSRYFGVGASRGWAWNQVVYRVPNRFTNNSWITRIRSTLWPDYPTFEFVQSFLIFFYGGTNVFLEHLGNEDGVWSHKDLQHASIAFMFFGGGLCGIILESAAVKRMIAVAFNLPQKTPVDTEYKLVRRGWSLNPMPAFIIFWTGALMSHHQQETELSTQIHIQWGTMFSLAAVLRLLTIMVLYLKSSPTDPEKDIECQRPFTEVLVAFCLICGGLIFMASNRETVEGMIYRGIDQMFTLNMSVGITVLMMSYFVCCLAVKGFVSRHSNKR